MTERDHGRPSDRIFVRNYVREIEIGAYPQERGITQRVRFDVTLEVGRTEAPVEDDHTRVVNYEDLVAAIEVLASGERINLLETFAERLAARILADPRARRVEIRIEKLDLLAGEAVYGVEIARDHETAPPDIAPEAPPGAAFGTP